MGLNSSRRIDHRKNTNADLQAVNSETNKLLAERYLGTATSEDFVDWAVACLESNLDSKNIRILASLQKPLHSSEVDDYFNRCLQDLGWTMPGRQECLLEYARSLAKQILSGDLTPVDGCRKMYRLVVALEYPRELMAWLYLDEGMDWNYGELQGADLDNAILSEANRLVQDGARFDLNDSVL